MTDQSLNQMSAIEFTFNPEPRSAQVDLTQGNFVEIVIVAQNLSGRPVSVYPMLVPVDSTPAYDRDPLSPAEWMPWLSLQDTKPELEFDPDGVHRFRVLINLPSYAPLGAYQFRLILSGVENPDEEIAVSDSFTFTVTGPKMDVRPFAIGSAIILVLVILGIIAAVLFLNRPGLQVTLDAPAEVAQGEMITYTLTVVSSGASPARNVMVEYFPPGSILAATAFVPGENLRHCDFVDISSEHPRSIRCDLGDLDEKKPVQVTLLAVPGPATETIVLPNNEFFKVKAQLGETDEPEIIPFQSKQEKTNVVTGTKTADNSEPFALALLPSTSTPLVGEDFTYQVLAWGTGGGTQNLTFTLSLPAGIRYVNLDDLPRGCQLNPVDYLKITCSTSLENASTNDQVRRFNLRARAATAFDSMALLQGVYTAVDRKSPPAPITELEAVTNVVNTALYFDGIDDWADLGYRQSHKDFTIEMWVHPYSNVDGQSFAGLHREEPDGRVSNLFLVGYWSGSLQVNINGEPHNLVSPKRTDLYHLAVVVDGVGENLSKVTVFIDGVTQEWKEPATVDDLQQVLKEDDRECNNCKIFKSTMPEVENQRPWVLGQDWDTGTTSDFFFGTLSEVRIWNSARSQSQIDATYRLRPSGEEANLEAYYRLEPVDPGSDVLVNRVDSAQPGRRMGATWVEAAPRYGTALQFNGYNQALAVPGLQLSSFKLDPSGYVDLTLAGWIMVDEIPSQQEWILGSTAPISTTLGTLTGAGSSIEMVRSLVAEEKAALESAEKELKSVQDNITKENLNAAQVITDSYNARLMLFYSVDNLLKNSPNVEVKVMQSGGVLSPGSDLPKAVSDAELKPLAANTSYLKIAGFASALQENLTRYQDLKRVRDELSQKIRDAKPTPTPTPKPQTMSVTICVQQPVFLWFTKTVCHNEDSPVPTATPMPSGSSLLDQKSTLPDVYYVEQVLLQMFDVLLVEEKAKFYANLQGLYNEVDQTAFDLQKVSPSLFTNKDTLLAEAFTIDSAYNALKGYPHFEVLLSLALCEDKLADVKKAGEQSGSVNWIKVFKDLETAQGSLDNAAAGLEAWLQAELQKNLQLGDAAGAGNNGPSRDSTIVMLTFAQHYLERYFDSQVNLEKIQANQEQVSAAQELVSAAQARENAVIEATQKENENNLLNQYIELKSSLESQQVREAAVNGLEPLLKTAVEQATEAAFSKASDYGVDSWIIPYLDLDLQLDKGTVRQIVENAIRQAALEAAQQAVQAGAGANEEDQKTLKDALAIQISLTNAGGKASASQQIIDLVNVYLVSLSYGSGEPRIPLVLAEALAEIIADRVAVETIQCLSFGSTCKLPPSSAPLEEQVKTTVEADVTNALETARRVVRIRLFYQLAHAVIRLEGELYAGGLSENERQVKVALRIRLADTNTALYQLLKAESLLLQPASKKGDPAEQAADQPQPASMNTSYQDFQKSVEYATSNLEHFLEFAQAQGRTTGLNAFPTSIPTAIFGENLADDIIMPNLWAGLLVDNDGHVMLAVRYIYSSNWIIRKDEKPLQPGKWVHYTAVIRYVPLTDTIVIDDTSPLLYRDGSPVKGDVKTQVSLDISTVNCPIGFYIGGLCYSSGRFFFAGRIDEVRVWNRLLTKADIDTWRKLPGVFFDEKAYWAFDDGPGSFTNFRTPTGVMTLTLDGPGWVESDIWLFQEDSQSP